MLQYTTQLLMPEVDKRIDDIQYANYSIPTLQHGERLLVQRDRVVNTAFECEYSEVEFVDARAEKTYSLPDLEFNTALNSEQLLQLDKLNESLRKLIEDKNVPDTQLKRVLDVQQFADYKESLTAEMHSSEITYGSGMPDELQTYKQLLKDADFQHNKFEKMSVDKRLGRKRFQHHTYERAKISVDKLYELALEQLDATCSSVDPMLLHAIETWMDRDLDFESGTDRKIGIDAETIPRIRGSKSKNALDSGLPKLSKRLKRKECQLLALKDAAWNLAFKQSVQSESADDVQVVRNATLNRLLQLRDDDLY